MFIEQLIFIAVAVFAVLIAGLSKGGFGAGASFVATPLLALVAGPIVAVAVLLPLLMLMDMVGLRAFWQQWNWRVVWPVMLSFIPGVALGWLLFDLLSVDWVGIILGLLTLLLLGYQFLNRLKIKAQRIPSFMSAGFWGSIAGFMSFVLHAGGPPVTLYLAPLNLDKRVYQACTVVLFAVVNTMKLPVYFALGLYDLEGILMMLWLFPLAPIAMWAGIWLHNKINQQFFYFFVYGLAGLASLKLLLDGIQGVLSVPFL